MMLELDFRPLAAVFLFFLLFFQTASSASIPRFLNASGVIVETPRSLIKRGCILSKESSAGSTGTVELGGVTEEVNLPICNTLDVSYYVDLITTYNWLPNRDCLFYLGLNGGMGQQEARQWYCKQRSFGRGSVAWDSALPPRFHSDLIKTYTGKSGPMIGDPSSEQTLTAISSRLLSQAMGETCSGNVYFFTPTSNDGTDPLDNVWYNFEYPALTRNPAVQSILKVDPTIFDDDGNYADQGTVMWTAAHGPSSNEALGTGYSYTF